MKSGSNADGPVVDALLGADLTVLVIAPGQLKNLRSRYGSAGNKTTGSTPTSWPTSCALDRHWLRPLGRDRAATTAMRTSVRAHLQLVLPAAACLFAAIDSAVSLSFLERFTTQTQADWLSVKRLGTWLKGASYSGRTDPAILLARLLAAPRGTSGPDTDVHAATTKDYIALLRVLTLRSPSSRTTSPTNSRPTPTPTSSRPCPASRGAEVEDVAAHDVVTGQE